MIFPPRLINQRLYITKRGLTGVLLMKPLKFENSYPS